MVRFLHTADWQLGMTRHFLSEEAQARFSAARLDVIGEMGNLAINEGCEFVVVCGDVFDSNQVVRQVLTRALEKMAEYPPGHVLSVARQPRLARRVVDLHVADLHQAPSRRT